MSAPAGRQRMRKKVARRGVHEQGLCRVGSAPMRRLAMNRPPGPGWIQPVSSRRLSDTTAEVQARHGALKNSGVLL